MNADQQYTGCHDLGTIECHSENSKNTFLLVCTHVKYVFSKSQKKPNSKKFMVFIFTIHMTFAWYTVFYNVKILQPPAVGNRRS